MKIDRIEIFAGVGKDGSSEAFNAERPSKNGGSFNEKFMEIRYNDFNWNEFKAYSSSIRSGELSAFADFDLYQSTSKEMDDKLLGIVTSNNITITGKSKHSIARVIGSVEQRRNGVQVSDILDALTNSESEIFIK